ncbi:hypothetical protein KM043_018271 [Ampulex compressa]|nr:hypothetical protein KM043_018271 [Ampulex compressa]
MGSGSFRWRILLIVIAILVLWQSSKVWLILMQENIDTQAQLQEELVITPSQENDHVTEKVNVAVYYEALCPDSRNFFIKQLLPMYQSIPDNVQVELVPYGKATTIKTDDGYEFNCQHGPIECAANIIHACSIDIIKNPLMQLEYLSCMIKNNIKPLNVMDICATKMNVDRKSILSCYTGTRGKELLAKYGEETDALNPRVSFIPTVTLNGNTQNQPAILKNLLQQVCLKFNVVPEGCLL